MHLTVTADLVAVTESCPCWHQHKPVTAVPRPFQLRCAWLSPAVLSPQAIYNVLRNVCYDLTLTLCIPIALDGTEDNVCRNTDVVDRGLNSDSEDSDSAQKHVKNTLR